MLCINLKTKTMKNILFLLIGMTSSFFTFSQEGELEDTTRFKVGTMEFIIINHGEDTLLVDSEDGEMGEDTDDKKKKFSTDDDLSYWSGFEFGPSILLNKSGSNSISKPYLNLDPAQSFSYNFNIAEKRIPFGTDHIGLVTGIGFTHSRYGLKNNNIIQANSDSTWASVDTTISYNKNQLRATYVTVPLLLNINTSRDEDKNFHIAAGVIGGVRISSKTLQKFELNGQKAKNKAKGVYNLNPFQAIATARVGYKDIGVFANYNLLPLFESGKTEDVFPLTVGISLHF